MISAEYACQGFLWRMPAVDVCRGILAENGCGGRFVEGVCGGCLYITRAGARGKRQEAGDERRGRGPDGRRRRRKKESAGRKNFSKRRAAGLKRA